MTDREGAASPDLDPSVGTLRSAPVISWLALAGAMAELAIARLAWHALYPYIEPLDQLEIGRWARFPRNLAAVAGMVAMCGGLASFMRLPGYASIPRRLTIAAFSGVFLPALLVATFLPGPVLRRGLVEFAMAACHVLVALMALTAVRYRAHPALRASVGIAAGSSILILLILLVGQMAQPHGNILDLITIFLLDHAALTRDLLARGQDVAEVAWLLAPLGAVVFAIWRGEQGRLRRAIAAGAGVLVTTVAIGLSRAKLGSQFHVLLYGSFRVELLDGWPLAYALPLGLMLAGGIAALLRRDSNARQVGAGTLFWLAAGMAPATPIRLLYLLLAALLWTRAAQADDPQGLWRTRQPWTRLLRRQKPA